MDYIFAVARIRYKEMSLLTSQFLERLIACETYKECLSLLNEKGWTEAESNKDINALLQAQRDQTWAYIAELVDDTSKFDVFKYANDFHNLKAAIKLACTNVEVENVFNYHSSISPDVIYQAVKQQDYSLLPEYMASAAQKAYDELSINKDGQMCDVIIDKAALEAILKAGGEADDEVIAFYAETTVACADIKIAARCAKMSKPASFITQALAECNTLNIAELSSAATRSFDDVCAYLSTTIYSEAANALRSSFSEFECWCDNYIIERIREQKYNSDTLGPIVAYMIAKENEIKVVKIILSGKLNELKTESIRERLRQMYV